MSSNSKLFIDESGKQSLAEDVDKPFILTGVILDNEEINPVEGFFEYIKRKYNIPTIAPFHSYDLLENSKTKLNELDSRAIVKTLAEFISLIPIKIKIVAINKKEFWKTLGIKAIEDFKGSENRHEIKNFPYRIMSSILFEWFAKYLDAGNKIGEIIVDARRGGDAKLIKSLDSCKEKEGPLPKCAKLIEERCTAICFAQKSFLSGGLEITDLISYTTFFHARKEMNLMNNIGLGLIWQEIRKKLTKKKLHLLSVDNYRSFFKLKKGEVHPYLIK
jgi:hypothetical protein